MPSFRSRLFLFVLKNRHLLRFKLKRRAFITKDTSMPKLREETERGANFFGKLPKNFTLEPLNIGNLYAEWIHPPQAPQNKAILYFHGGGYVIGSCLAHRPIVSKVVKGTGISALVFNYRLAPENPFPAALDDSLAAYQHLLSEGRNPEDIVFMGDSAGGGLCLATLLALKEKKMPLPQAVVTLSPWTDLKNTGKSLEENAELDTLTWKESQEIFSEYYVGKNDANNPLISPLYGDLEDLPPLLMYVGSDELMRDDSTRFAKKAKQAGVDVTLNVGEEMFHCYPACAPLFPEATQAMGDICEFIEEWLR